MPASAPDRPAGRTLAQRVAPALRIALPVALALYATSRLAVLRLRADPYPLDLREALRGAATTADATIPAALATWTVVGLALVAVGGWLQRLREDLSASEAAVGAVVLLWALTDMALLCLGPIGWYRPIVLRALLAAIVLATLRSPRRRPARWPPGAWVAALAVALVIVPLLLMQIGSPVSPFMDILALIASVQKIVTFRLYDPFANDASGIIALGRGSVGYDAPLSFVALITGLPAHLAISALIVPCAVLQLTTLYLLGRRVQGSMAGGMATLFLLQTFTWRRTADIRGTCLAFALVAAGLAFLAAARRHGLRTALGGLALGTSVTVNPLIGGVGMMVASLQTIVAWLDCGEPLIAPVAALAAGSVFALPQVLIGLTHPAPVWLLPIVAALGLLLTLVAGRLGARAPWGRRHARPWSRVLGIAGLPFAVLLCHARRQFEFVDDQWFGYEILALLATLGLAAAASEVWRHPARRPAAAIPALALAVGMITYYVASPRRFAGTLDVRSLASEVTTKMIYYWSPYWLALATGVGFAWLGRRRGRVPAVVLALVLVIYPFRNVPEPLDYDAQELSLAETWGFNLTNAARGYHAGLPDRRWVVDERWRDVGQALLDEVAAGRITYDTHVVYVSPGVNSVEAALWTGISMDVHTPQWSADNIWTVGTRVRGMQQLPAALAARPPYVLIQSFGSARTPDAADYEQLIARPGISLYRRRDLAAAPAGNR